MSQLIKIFIFFCFLLIVLQEYSLAQLRNEVVDGDTILVFTHPMRDKFEENVSATVLQTDSSLVYSYRISSSPDSEQNIWFWMIITDVDILGFTSPSGWRFINRAKNPERISWGTQSDSAKIRPSSSISGFSVKSKNLPTIQKYFMEGWKQIILDPENEPDSVENKSFFDVAKEGLTIFPRSNSDIFNLQDFTDTLQTFRYRSCEELEWATDTTVCGQLEQQVNQVGDHLSTEDTVQAANALKEFIDLVEAEKNASLTSEGYALLYYNAQYLAARLPEPGPTSGITCGCDNPVTQSSGTITIRNGETKCLNTSFSGSVFFESGGTLNVCSTANLQNIYGNQPGQINVSESGDVTVGNWNNNYAEDGLTNWGTTVFSNQATVNNGALVNHGEITVNGGLNQNNGLITNHGQLDVGNDLNINTSGNANTGSLFVGGRFILNSGSFQNECQIQAGSLMINGLLDNSAGSSVISGGQLTLNSSGEIALGGGKAMLSVESAMLNGTVTSEGENLLVSQNTINYNSGASITANDQPLYVVAPNLSNLIQDFAVTNGYAVVIPATTCNPQGYNVSGN